MEFIGIELSPSSSHFSMKKIRDPKTTQTSVNEDLAKKWTHEMKKRRDFFEKLGISTITFTETDLQDLDSVFSKIQKYLSARKQEAISLASQLKRL